MPAGRKLRTALSAIGDGNVDEVALDLSKHGQLFEFLRASEAHKGRTGSIEERLRLLDRVERHGDGQRDLEKLRGATESLRSWLREPAPETLPDRIRMRRPWILSAIAIAVAGAGMAVFVDPWFALLVAAAAGIALPVFGLGNKSVSFRRTEGLGRRRSENSASKNPMHGTPPRSSHDCTAWS